MLKSFSAVTPPHMVRFALSKDENVQILGAGVPRSEGFFC